MVDRYGPPEVVRVADVPRPDPRAGEVLVRVHSVAVTSGDARIRAARFPRDLAAPARLALGIRRPRRSILGSSFSGVVEAVGPGVTDVSPGDEVCGMSGTRMGAHAEFLVVPAPKLVRTPSGVCHDDAAGVLFGAGRCTTCGQGIGRTRHRRAGQRCVRSSGDQHGAASPALRCDGDRGDERIERGVGAAGLGAEHVIDHTSEELTEVAERFDVVLDTVGNLTIRSGRQLLREGGVLQLTGREPVAAARARRRGGRQLARATRGHPASCWTWLTDGELTVVHDRSYDLDHIVNTLPTRGHRTQGRNVMMCTHRGVQPTVTSDDPSRPTALSWRIAHRDDGSPSVAISTRARVSAWW